MKRTDIIDKIVKAFDECKTGGDVDIEGIVSQILNDIEEKVRDAEYSIETISDRKNLNYVTACYSKLNALLKELY